MPKASRAPALEAFVIPGGSMVLTPDGMQTLLTPAEASRIFNVTPATIRKWAQLNKIQPSGLDQCGRKLYRLIDIALYERETRQRSGRDKRTIKLSA